MVAGGAYAAHKYRQRQDAQADEAAAPVDEAPEQEGPAGAGDDTAKLVQLKSLLDSGALTQAEFDIEKQKILGT